MRRTRGLHHSFSVRLLLPLCFRAGCHRNSSACRAGPRVSRIPEGLKSLITDILVTIKSGDAQKSSQLLAALSLPDHHEWFLQSFGATEAPPRVEAKYVALGSKEIGRSRQTRPDRCYCQSFSETRRRQPAVLRGRLRFHGHQPRGNAQKAKLVDKVPPVYPPRAKQHHIEGTVALGVIIGTGGTIDGISPISGPPDLVLSAIDAVKLWGYLPTLLMGIPSKPQIGST